jgi:hypothetical protein
MYNEKIHNFRAVLWLRLLITNLSPRRPDFDTRPVHVILVVGKSYWNRNTNHQQMHKENFIINRNTLLHVSTMLDHLQGELFVTVTLGLHIIVE